MTWRDEIKVTVERRLVSVGLLALSRRARRRSVLILAYHNVVPEGLAAGGDKSLHLPEAAFAAQLDLLQETHDVVPLEMLLNGGVAACDRPQAVITFDDAYQGAVTVGVREVVRRALSATIFVAPAFVGGRFFWWDAVTQATAPGPPESCRRHALEACRGEDAAVRRWAERAGYQISLLPDNAACASIDELHAAASQPGITLASHSWSHPNLRRLPTSELKAELTQPLVWLRDRFDHVLPVLSYPYGLASPAVESGAASAGYRAGVRVSGGWATRRPRNPFALPRWNVPASISHDGFLLRTAGLLFW